MPSCAFMCCTNNSKRKNKSNGITFHSLPGDVLVRHKWLLVVRKQRREPDWIPNQHSRICSIHFEPKDMYTTNKGYRRLSKTAVPFFRLDNIKSENETDPMQDVMMTSVSELENTVPSAVNTSKPASDQSLNSDDDIDSDTETDPKITFLLRKIEKVLADKKRLVKDNGSLKKKNKRLTQKCKRLKGIVVHLNEKVSELEAKLEQYTT